MAEGSVTSKRAGGAEDKPSFSTRFRAWWEGYDPVPTLRKRESPRLSTLRAEPEEEPHQRGWPETRRLVVQGLFGEGMISPGGSMALLKLIKPLGLDEKMSVVELGAGLGGLSRLIVRETGTYVTGFEADPELAGAGMDLSVKAGLSRKAKVVPGRPEKFDVRPRSVDAVLAKEALLTVEDKSAAFQAIRRSLKPGGQLMMTDFMLAGDALSPSVQAWLAYEPLQPHLITPVETRRLLEELGLEVRILEDMTSEYQSSALAAFADFAARLKGEPPDEKLRRWALAECEHWSRRLAVLQAGDVRLMRLYARLPGVKELT